MYFAKGARLCGGRRGRRYSADSGAKQGGRAPDREFIRQEQQDEEAVIAWLGPAIVVEREKVGMARGNSWGGFNSISDALRGKKASALKE